MKDFNNNSIIFYFLFSLFITITSCKNKDKEEPRHDLEEVEISINLPQKIIANREIEGEIIYSSYFDTINLKKNERRFISLYLTKSNKRIENINELKLIKLDTFVAINNNIIPIFDLKFTKKGEMFLEGYIVDEVYLYEDKENLRIKTLETKLSHSIIVD